MRVLQVLPTLSAGGAEGFVTNLGVSLTELGAEVRFFLMAGVRGERGQVLFSRLRRAGIEVVGAEERNIRSPASLLALTSLIRRWRPHIVQANLFAAEVLVAAARALSVGSGARYVHRLAGSNICGYRSPRIVRLMDRCFRQTIACSAAVAEAYRAFVGPKHKSSLVIIPNGGLLQKAVTTAERRRSRQMLGIPERSFVIAHVGRMVGGAPGTGLEPEAKAQDILLQAFAEAFKDRPDSILALVGDGPLRPEAEALARALGIAEQTRFLGERPEPWPALQAADAFCFPSRYEGLPNVLPEAASCGLPVVASDIPEIRSLSPGDAWLLKPVNDVQAFADGLRQVAMDYVTFRQRAEAVAPKMRERFSMKACAQRYMDAYEAVL